MNKHPLKPGDILVMSWGYDQTNIDYFKVEREVGATLVELTPIGSKIVESNGPFDKVVPDPKHDVSHLWDHVPMRKKPRPDGTCKIFSWGGFARLWDGRPRHETAAGWGH